MEKMDLKKINLREYALSKNSDEVRRELIDEIESNPSVNFNILLENIDNFQVFMELFQNNWMFFRHKLKLINIIMEILAKKKINYILKYALENKDFYDLFDNAIGSINFVIKNYDYDILKLYLQKDSSIVFRKFYVSEDHFNKLIHDDLKDELIKEVILTYQYSGIINDFFRNDRRASVIFDELEWKEIVYLIKRDVTFPREFFLTSRFFEKIKANSLITFRNNVNFVTYLLGDLSIEKKLEEYYDALLKSYNQETGYYSIYNSLTTGKVLSREEYGVLWYYGLYGGSAFLRDLSNKKMSEIIIDYLFKDNIYNVLINIREMLRYDDYKKHALLSPFVRRLFKKVSMIDGLSPKEKLAFFEEFKGKGIDSLYYDSYALLKKDSYMEMNNALIKIDRRKDKSEDKELSRRYLVYIYDYRERPFYMVVRSLFEPWKSKNHNPYDCYSLISNENTQIYNRFNYVYGYNNINPNSIIHHFEADSYSEIDDSEYTTKKINRIMMPREIVMSNNFYSELQIKNKRVKGTKNTFSSLRPSYIVAVDGISKKIVDESNRLNIPVILIRNKVLPTTMGEEYIRRIDEYEYAYDAKEEYEKRSKR